LKKKRSSSFLLERKSSKEEEEDAQYDGLKSSLWMAVTSLYEDAEVCGREHKRQAENLDQAIQPLDQYLAVYEKLLAEIKAESQLLAVAESGRGGSDTAVDLHHNDQSIKILQKFRDLEGWKGSEVIKFLKSVVQSENELVERLAHKNFQLAHSVDKIDFDEDMQAYEQGHLSSGVKQKITEWTMSGLLYKRVGEGLDDWETRYFILKGEQKMLYFFENKNLIDVKGSLDLKVWTVHDLHESYLLRPNCFQLIQEYPEDPKQKRKVIHLSTNTTEEKIQWMRNINSACSNNTKGPIKYPRFEGPDVTTKNVIRNLNVDIMSGDFTNKEDFDCEIGFSDDENFIPYAKTAVKYHTSTPLWSEKFSFKNIYPNFTKLIIQVHGKKSQLTKRRLFGTISIDISQNSSLEFVKAVPFTDSTDNLLSITLKYEESKILPLSSYWNLFNSLFSRSDDVTTLQAIQKVFPNEGEVLASHILDLLEYGGGNYFASRTIALLSEHEILLTKDSATLFRSSSFATKMAEMFMRRCGKYFLENALKVPLNTVLNDPESCEIDPAKLTDASNRLANQDRLVKYIFMFWEGVFKSIKFLPNEMRALFRSTNEAVKSMRYDGPSAEFKATSGFFFLRYIVPAIMNPQRSGLIEKELNPNTQRNLILISKALQSFGNFIPISRKEDFMVPVINIIQKEKNQELKQLSKLLCELTSSSSEISAHKPGFSLKLAEFHKLLQPKLEALEQIQNEIGEESLGILIASIKKLGEETDDQKFFPNASSDMGKGTMSRTILFRDSFTGFDKKMLESGEGASSSSSPAPAPAPSLSPSSSSSDVSRQADRQFTTTVSSFLNVQPPAPQSTASPDLYYEEGVSSGSSIRPRRTPASGSLNADGDTPNSPNPKQGLGRMSSYIVVPLPPPIELEDENEDNASQLLDMYLTAGSYHRPAKKPIQPARLDEEGEEYEREQEEKFLTEEELRQKYERKSKGD